MNDDRASKAWKAGKERQSKRVRPALSHAQKIEFLELVAQMASRSTFERRLGLNASDITFYKKELDVESQDEARRLARALRSEHDEQKEAQVLEQLAHARQAEEVAQARLNELEARKQRAEAEKPRRKVDVNKVKQEDAERQRRFAAQQADLEEPKTEWRLPIEAGQGSEQEQIDRFRREIIYHGLSFVRKKHRATNVQIKWEATRLGLKINWDIVRA
jgi:hypothetical protein